MTGPPSRSSLGRAGLQATRQGRRNCLSQARLLLRPLVHRRRRPREALTRAVRDPGRADGPLTGVGQPRATSCGSPGARPEACRDRGARRGRAEGTRAYAATAVRIRKPWLAVVPEEVVHPGLLGGWWFSKPQFQGGHRMKLHANAALSLTQRRRMVLRVLEQGWSIRAAAAAAETSPQNVWEVGGQVPDCARVRSVGSQQRPASGRQPHRRAADRSDRRVATAQVDRPGDRRAASDAALDGVGDPDQDRDGPARSAGL